MDQPSYCLSFLRRASLFKDVLVAILVGITLMMPCYAGIPEWWIGRQVVRAEVTDDVYAALNAGQLKHAVKQAVQEMNAKLTGGAGTDLNGLVSGWGSPADNYEMVNAGQLKAVLKKFYDRMNEAHGTTGYPWPAMPNTQEYFEAVNVGQLKKLLRVDVSLAWNQNLAQGVGTTAGPILTAPTGDLGNQSGILAAADHYLKNQLLNLAARGGNPIAIPANPEAIENAPVATTAGEFKVGQDGSANYTIRIQGPKGVGNVEPAISLDYNSNGGNSSVGLGWNLSGLSVINRGPTSVEVDGYFDPADFDANDRFYLDGERLICVAGSYAADGSEYRTLKEQFSRVIYHKTATEDWFEVQTKAGLTMEFGHDDTSSIGPMENGQWSSHPKLTWAVSKVRDSLGNYWQAQYADFSQGGDAGEDTPYLPDYQPSTVRYTGNSGLSRDPMHEIRFLYEERPDQNRGYLMGFLVRKSRRLYGIEISTLGTVIKSYRLRYQMEPSFIADHGERSMLTSVQEIAGPLSDASAPRLPETVFTWEEGQRTWDTAETLQTWELETGGLPANEHEELRLEYRPMDSMVGHPLRNRWFSKQPNYVDVDGDGLNEIVTSHMGVHWAEKYFGGGYLHYPKQYLEFCKRTDNSDHWKVSDLGADFPFLTSASFAPTGAMMMDVNADGLPDIVSSGSFDRLKLTYLQGGSQPAVTVEEPSKIENSRGVWINQNGVFVRDFDGITDTDADGNPGNGFEDDRWGQWSFPKVPTEFYNASDAVIARPSTVPAGTILSGDNEKMQEPDFAVFKQLDLGWRMVDLDGDGFTDIIRAGQGFSASGWATSATVSAPIATGTGALSTAGRELCFGLRNKGPDAAAGQKWELINPDPNTNSIWKLPLPLVDDDGRLDMGRRLLDMNGDGLPDFVAQKKRVAAYPSATFPAYSYGAYDIEVWLNRGAAGWEHQGPVNGQANPWTLEGMVLAYGMLNIDMEYGRMLQDMNGDGLPDFVVSFEVYAGYTQKAVFLNTGSGWVKKDGEAINFINLAPPEYLFFNSGALTSTRPYSLMDMTGDGRPEFLNSFDTDATLLPGSTNKVGLTQFMGMNGTWTSSSVERAATDWNIPDELLATSTVTPLNFTELDGDGVMDVLRVQRLASGDDGYNDLGCRTYFRRGLSVAPRISHVTNGLGVPMKIEYGQLPALAKADTADPHYEHAEVNGQRDFRSYPYQNQTPAGTVVTKYTTLDGTEDAQGNGGREITSSYFYSGLRYHALKGSLGFEKMETRSDLSPVRQETTFSQAGDSIGMPLGGESFILNAEGGRQLLSQAVTIYGAANIKLSLEAPNHYSRFAFAHVVTNENWSPEGAYMGKTSSENTYWQWGALAGLLDSQTVTLDQGTPADTADDSTSATSHDYDDPITTGGEWRIGQIRGTTVSSYAPGTPSVGKRSEFEYYPSGHASAGLLKSETIDATSLPITKTHGYDASGNEVKTVTTADGMPPVVSETWFDASGRFPLASVNALGHAVRTTYDVQRSLTTAQYMAFASDAPNADPTAHSPQIPAPPSGHPKTTTTYDSWSTAKITTGPDGLRSVRFTQLFSDASLPKCLYYVYEQAEGSPPVVTYYDRYHRALMVEKTGFNGEVILQESQAELIFNESGEKTGSRKRSSQPYFAGGQLPGYAVEEYDAYDRKTKVTAPDGSWTTVAYNGFKTTMTNQRNQTQERVVDQSERIIESKDTDGHKVIFAYTADGQPRLATTVYAGNASPSTTITTTYNAQGLKETVTDPNTGTSQTYYDAYGRVTESIDSRGSLTVTRYDALGRMVRRKTGVTNFFENINIITQFETDTQWVYDLGTTATSNGLGKPRSVTFTHKDGASTRTVTELYTYDALGRSVSTIATLAGQVAFNGEYTSSTLYHPSAAPGYGRVDTITDPGLYTRASVYNAHGFLSEVHEGSATGDMLWRGMLYDAEGKVLTEHHGNGIGTTSRYHPTRGFTESSLTYRWTTNAPIQDLKMRINDIGNVEWRQLTRYESVAAGVSLPEPEVKTETFGFDSLNRLTSSHVVGHDTQSFSFEVNGNIQTKSGIGTYGYGQRGHGPHAVTSVTLGTEVQRSYSYDAKGRMLKEFVGDVTNEATQTALREIAYTSFDQPSFIQHWGAAALSSDLGALDDGQSAWDQLCTLNFYFGPGMQRLIQTKHKGLLATKVLSLGGYEIRETTSGTLTGTLIEREERSSFGNGTRTKRWTVTNPNTPVISYEFAAEDHLGSDSVTYDKDGQLQMQRGHLKGTEAQKTERQSYDAWGARRDGETWAPAEGQLSQGGQGTERVGSNLPRGYTGHEMLDDVGLIHMNGRLYDAALGRMCMADPYVQSPENLQNYNRYSYVLNNPLSAIDPSGHVFGFIVALVGAIIGAVGAVITAVVSFVAYMAAMAAQFVLTAVGLNGAAAAMGQLGSSLLLAAKAGLATVMTAAGSVGAWAAANPILAGAVFGGAYSGAQTAINGGSFSDVLKSAATGAITGAIGGAVGQLLAPISGAVSGAIGGSGSFGAVAGAVVHSAAHGVAGGLMSMAMGGTFQDGFIGSAIGAGVSHITGFAFGGVMDDIGIIGRTAIAAISGGAAAALAGGKFSDGAYSAAFFHLFNHELHRFPSIHQDAAIASAVVYLGGTSEVFSSLGIPYSESNGFGAGLYWSEKGGWLLAFRGTELTIDDARADLAQSLGISTDQYEMAIDLARRVSSRLGGKVTYVGHSLGGGLASAAAIAMGGNAITFNAAGLSPTYGGTFSSKLGFQSHTSQITAHYIGGEVLSSLQDNLFLPGPSAVGKRVYHSPNNNGILGSLNDHSISNFLPK